MTGADKNQIGPGEEREPGPVHSSEPDRPRTDPEGAFPSTPAEKGPVAPSLILLIPLVLITSWGWSGRLFEVGRSDLGQLPGLLALTGLTLAAALLHLKERAGLGRRREAGEGEERITGADLRAQLSFQAAVLEGAAEGFGVCRFLEEEPDPTFVLWTRRMAGITGYEMEQINALGFYRALFPAPGTRAEAREGMLLLAAGENGRSGEWTITRADGRQRTVNISISALETEEGRIHLFLARDLSDQVKAERALKEREAGFLELVRHAPVALLGLDPRPAADRLSSLRNLGIRELKAFLLEHPEEALRVWGAVKVTDANRAALDLLRADDLEELGQDWPGFISSASAAVLGTGLAEITTQGGVFQAEVDCLAPEGRDRHFYAHLFLRPGEASPRPRLLLALSDVSELEKVKGELGLKKDRLELAARASGMGIWDWDLETGRLYLDPGSKTILGQGNEGTIDPGQALKEILNLPEAKAAGAELPEDPEGSARLINHEHRLVDGDGRVRWVLIRGESIPGRDGRTVRMVGTAIDVSGWKRKEEAGQWSEALVESAPRAIIGLTLEGLITSWNTKAEEVFGYGQAEIIGQHLFYLFPPERTSEATRTMARVRAGERVDLRNSELLSGEGRRLQVSLSFFPLKDGRGGITGAAFIARDLEPALRADGEHQARQETMEAFINASSVGICRISHRALEWASPAFHRMLGYPEGSLRGREIKLLYPHQDEYLRVGRSMLNQLAREGRAVIDTRWARKDGRVINCHLESRPIDPADPDKGQVLAVMDVTERARAEEERSRLAAALEQAKDLVLVTDPEMKIAYVNPAAETTTGFSRQELVGRRAAILGAPELDSPLVKEELKYGRTWSGHVVLTRKDGTTLDTELSLSPILDQDGGVVNFVGVARDVTSELDLRNRLRQAQKLEAIGTLAGGIAHDFNNILAGIMGYTELMLPEVREHPKLLRRLGEILKASERAKNLIQQILTFSRQSETENKPVQVSLVAKEALKLLRASIPSNVEIIRKINPDSGRVLSDPVKLHQVIINLCTNAAQAMMAEGGRLEVGLDDVQMGAKELAGWSGLKPGPYLKLWVRDTGPGIDPKVGDRIFDPYFTTKKPTEGTGLGLATVHGIVTECHGAIKVESQPGEGACFEILLPRVLARKEVQSRQAPEVPTGTETILFVDDEATLVEMTTERLETLGYKVVGRTSPVEAWEIFKADPKRFDLIITDQTMPKMTGIELSLAIMGLRPEIPVILCTGFSEVISPEKAMDLGIKDFLYKPIVTEQMAKAVRKALDQVPKNL